MFKEVPSCARAPRVPERQRNAQLHLHVCWGSSVLSIALESHSTVEDFILNNQLPRHSCTHSKALSTCLKIFLLLSFPPSFHLSVPFSLPSSLDLRSEQNICPEDEDLRSIFLNLNSPPFTWGLSPIWCSIRIEPCTAICPIGLTSATSAAMSHLGYTGSHLLPQSQPQPETQRGNLATQFLPSDLPARSLALTPRPCTSPQMSLWSDDLAARHPTPHRYSCLQVTATGQRTSYSCLHQPIFSSLSNAAPIVSPP